MQLAAHFVVFSTRDKLAQVFVRQHLEDHLDELGHFVFEGNLAELVKADLTAIQVLARLLNAQLHLQ